jgi:EAL domain-containing protein (putative c-di-GMP-specific phosphodiesterase class I)
MTDSTIGQLATARPAVLLRRAVAYATGIDEAAESPSAGASVALDGTLLALAAAAIGVMLAIALAGQPENRPLLAAMLGSVLAGASLAAAASRLGYKTVSAFAILTAILGWPLLAICLALGSAGSDGQAIVPAIAVAFIVAFSLSAVLRPALAVLFLILFLAAEILASGPNELHTSNLIGVAATATAGLFAVSGRMAIERMAQSRRQIGYLTQRLTVAGTLEETAAAIAAEIADSGGFELVLLSAYLPGGIVRHLAHASSLPHRIPLEPGRSLRPNRAEYLLERAYDEPWIDEWEPTSNPTDFTSQMYEAGLRTSLYVPVRHQGSPIGVLAIGCGLQTSTLRLRRRALLEHARTGMVEAASLVGTLLAPQIARYDDESAQVAVVRSLIERRRYVPVFQPIVDLESGSVVGYESLTRFPDGERPDILFEYAARIGVGQELEAATLESAVEAAEALPGNAYLSVNVSPEFLLSGTPARILRRLARPVAVELTEHVKIDDYEAIRIAAANFGRPIRLVVDDAGAGFASLRHVLELRPDTVKLDLALVRHIDADPARQALVAGMVHFAERGHFALVAEGVETVEERETLISLGVAYGQGYLFGRAMPVPSERSEEAAA